MACELIRGLGNIPLQHSGFAVTIGNFDGVHRGHQMLLAKLKEESKRLQVPSLVFTFEPHPQEFFATENVTPRLSSLRDKFYQFAQYGIDQVLVVRFDEVFARLSAEDFVKQILCERLGVKHVIIGDDFRFGQGRKGNFEFLKNASQQAGFSIERIPGFILDNERVSSTLVRKALSHGDHQQVEKLLGRPFSIMGRIVHGDKRGRLLGFPTANIFLHRQVTPVHGIYTVRMHGLGGRVLPGVASVGTRPTVPGSTRCLLEVHLFDFNEDIYGQHVLVEFCEKLREEKRFDNFDLLTAQMHQDAAQAKDYFKKRGE